MKTIVKNPVITLTYGNHLLNGNPYNHAGIDIIGDMTDVFNFADCEITAIKKPDLEYPVKFKKDEKTGKWESIKIPADRAWTPFIKMCLIDSPSIMIILKHVNPVDELTVGKYFGITKIADYGNFGFCYGAHLHVEIYQNGSLIDPLPFLKNRGIL